MTDTDRPAVSQGLKVTLGVVVFLAVILGFWLFLMAPLLEDDGIVEVPATAPDGSIGGVAQGPAPAPLPSLTPVPDATGTEPVPETFEVFNARDPFQQLVVDDSQGQGQQGPGQPGASPSPGSTASPGDPNGDGTSRPPQGSQVGGTIVVLVDVITDDAGQPAVLVTVNGTGYQANEGETFADRFRVLDISGECATFLFGDSRFVLCVGEEIRK